MGTVIARSCGEGSPKCRFVIYKWDIRLDGTAVLDQHLLNRTLQVQDSETSTTMEVESLQLDTAYKYLGAQMSADGNTLAQETALKHKCDHLATVFATDPLHPHDILVGYNTIYGLLRKYPLEEIAIAHTAAYDIQNKITNAALPKLGDNRHFPREVGFGPVYLGGCGLINILTKQGVAHITTILKPILLRTTLWMHIIALLVRYQVTTGIMGNPLAH